MESQIITTVLKRCRLDDVVPILRKWNALSTEFVRSLGREKRKCQIAAEVVQECEERDVTMDSAGLLDLICLQLTSDRKIWEVYSIKISQEEERTFPASDADKFNRELKALLNLYFGPVHTNMNIFAGFLWGRVHFVPSLPRRSATPVYQPADVVYFVYPPHTRMLVATKMKVAYKSSFIRVFQRLFASEQISLVRLSGHDVFSLVDLVVNKNSQSSFGQFSSQGRAENPLVRRKRRRDPEEEEEEVEGEMDPRVVCENSGQKQARQEYLNRIYGPHPSPILEKLQYKMEVKFRGTEEVPAMAEDKEPFKCQVTFTGTSVLGGLKSLPRHGFATTPLPKHVSRVQSLAVNIIHIKENK